MRNKKSPHRGQETITYLLHGGLDHEDFAGNAGSLDTGDLQFMTAGRGIVHAEMPRPNPDGSPTVALQFWVDLPSTLKTCEPRYRDLRASEIPSAEVDDGRATIRVISGQSHGIDSVKDLAYTPVWLLDVEMRPGARITQPLPATWNAFAYVLEGEAYFSDGAQAEGEEDGDKRRSRSRRVPQYHNIVFEQAGDLITIETDPKATKPARISMCPPQPSPSGRIWKRKKGRRY